MQGRRWFDDLAATTRALPPLRRFVVLAAALGVAGLLAWLGVAALQTVLPALAGGSVPGLELFERSNAGTPELVQRVNLRRALQGELRHSIEGLAPVESARVQLAMPESDGARATASVVLQLRTSRALTPAQLHGIRQLVASSVDGLAAQDVSVLDSAGNLLAEESAVAGGVPGRDLALEAELDRELGARAQSLLERTVGAGRVAVSVRAELDWSHRDETRESFNPDGQVERSEERTTEPAGAARAAGRSTERVEYEVGKQVTHEVSPAGNVKRLNVAVLVDGKPSADGKAGEFTPWSEPELQQLEALAKQAVGFSAERGDALTLTNAPFREGKETQRFSPELLSLVADGLRYAAVLVGLLFLAQLAFRALGDPEAVLALPMSAAELEAALVTGGALGSGSAGRASSEGGSSQTNAQISVPEMEPDAGAATLRAWLNED